MQYLSYIVGLINAPIAAAFAANTKLANSDVMGICSLMQREYSDPREPAKLYPAQYIDADNFKYAGVDDGKDAVLYHRALSISTRIDPYSATKKTYGDAKCQKQYNVARMCMVVWADRSKCNLSSDEMAMFIQAHMPCLLSNITMGVIGLQQTQININEIILNETQVFNEEYKNVEYFIKPEQYLIKINYTIESEFDKACFNNVAGNGES